MHNYQGLESARTLLEKGGWKLAPAFFARSDNRANWYAYKRTELPASECECNEGKRMQIVIEPFCFDLRGQLHEGVEIKVTGEAGGEWFELKAYSIRADELPSKLAAAEKALIAAWNALPRDFPTEAA